MSTVKIVVRKYGQITEVYVDGRKSYSSGNTVRKEIEHINILLNDMHVENFEVVEE